MTTMALHGSLSVRQKSIDKVALSLDRSESQATRLSQPNPGIAGNCECLTSCRGFLTILNLQPLRRRDRLSQAFFFFLSHVSEANLASRSFDKPDEFGTTFTRNVVDPRSRDTLESPILEQHRSAR